jgi:hypothetical protein
VANNIYEVTGLIPSASDFTLEKAVHHFGSLVYRKMQLSSELAKGGQDRSSDGFRVRYGNWGIVAWLDDSLGVLDDSQHLMAGDSLPTRPEIIGTCARRLWIYSDEDPDLDHSDDITHFTDELRRRFGLLILDHVNGGWWT